MANAQPITAAALTADAYVVVTWWQDRSGDPRAGKYEYEHCGDLNEASDRYTEYEAGEFPRATAMGIFPARNGMPCGDKLSALTVSRLVRETVAA